MNYEHTIIVGRPPDGSPLETLTHDQVWGIISLSTVTSLVLAIDAENPGPLGVPVLLLIFFGALARWQQQYEEEDAAASSAQSPPKPPKPPAKPPRAS